MKYKLKDDADFKIIRKKALKKYNFDLADYYDEKTRTFTFPQGYVAWHLMAEVFRDFLEPLNLVEKVGNNES